MKPTNSRVIIVLLLTVFLTSCSNSQHNEVGKFVYVDCFNTIHTDKDCAANLVDNPKTKDERMANMQGIEFIDTCFLSSDSWSSVGVMRPCPYRFCPKCVDDEAYKRLLTIMERNKVKPPAY